MRLRRHPIWNLPLTGALVLTLAAAAGAASAGATGGAAPTAGASMPASAPPSTADSDVLTLVTGDQVSLEQLPEGRQAVTIDPADRSDHEPSFETITQDEQVYVIPSDAALLVPDVLDRELFNVTKLAEYGYTGGVPVIVTHQDAGTARRSAGMTGASVTATLSSIDAVAATIEPGGAWWTAAQPVEAPARAASGPLAGVEKVWLDELAEVTLDESVPLVGAPEAWAAGYDGTGLTIAVLDTGIDAGHPDLAGKVIEAENFTTEPDATDGHGHGTHVSGIVAGNGTASGGTYTGIARGAHLLNGKVCNAGGTCPNSGIIAGMEWAAPQADVISLSVSTTAGSDGTDPMSQAVNTLTAQHDTLFVIAAGNSGAFGDGSVGSPGAADAALTVGSVDKSEQLAGTSSRGPRLGDFAIKPDLTAPGVSIVSARGAGTSLGTPVDDFYTTVSGTSMATPHVSGAAAILLQQDPDLSAAELKAALATTGVPHDDLDVYQQGGGRLDIPTALDAPVRATPAPLDLGYFLFPHDDAEPVDSEVTYTNRTDATATLDLSLDVENRDGDVPPDAMLSVSPDTLVVEPGGTATATVTLDVREGELGLYGGYLVAETDGDVVTRTPVGFTKEHEMYDLTVEALGRDGEPAFSGSKVTLWDGAADEWESKDLIGGTATFRVPPGDHAVMAYIFTIDAMGRTILDATLAGQPELSVTEDTTLTLDAREGKQVVVDAKDETEHQGVTLGWYRAIGDNDFISSFGFNLFTDRVFAVPTERVQRGVFEFYSRWDLFAPQLRVQALGKADRFNIRAEYLTGAPKLDGRRRLPVLDAGLGTPEELDAADVTGSVALMRSTTELRPVEQVTNAAAAGAQAAVIYADRPGKFIAFVGEVPILGVSVSQEDGNRLLRQLDEGRVVLDLRGTWPSPFVYDLVLPEEQRIPTDLTYRITAKDVATVRSAFHGGVAGQLVGDVRFYFRPYDEVSFGVRRDYPVPFARTDYISANDTTWAHAVLADPPFDGEMLAPFAQYRPGEDIRETWLKSPSAPGIPPGDFRPDGRGYAAYREGDVLHVEIPEFGDDRPDHFGFREFTDDTAARLYRNGELLAEASTADADFDVPADEAQYRLELDVARNAAWWTTSTATQTAWTFHSEPADGDERTLLPLLDVDFHLDVDGLNRARAGQPAAIDFTVRHQPGLSGPRIDNAELRVSYDDGASWTDIRQIQRRPGNTFRAWLTHPPLDETSGYVAIQIRADDIDGNAIEQSILRAYALTE